uniref:Olfactory receptor n=1 Tax=Sus scrofa TaxID=9823 RepID=A0A4X1U152_PIG
PGIIRAMENANDTTGINFILLGLFNHTQTHLFLFSIVLMTFLTSLMGNIFMIFQLSLMDIMLVLTIVPKMAVNYLMNTRSISPAGCGTQIFLFLTLGGGECFLLAAMAYDRYVAICHPLRYPILMNQKLCLHMTAGSWVLGGVDGLMQAAATLSFPYCHSREINHFFCESTAARKKAFSTCSSHLAVVGLFFGTIMFIYMWPKSYHSVAHDKVVSTFYTIFTPVLNPLIYSVRNKEVKGALRKFLEKHFWWSP